MALASLNACQDSQGRKPVNKVKGKTGLEKGSGTPVVSPVHSPGVKPKVEDADTEDTDTAAELVDVTTEEKEIITKAFEDLNAFFNKSWAFSKFRNGSSKEDLNKEVDNYFGFVKSQLSSGKLILREVNFGTCSGEFIPYLLKSKNKNGDDTQFIFGLYLCAKKTKQELMAIDYDSQTRKATVSFKYSQVNFDSNMIGSKYDVGIMEVLSASPNCEVEFKKDNVNSLKNIKCQDLGLYLETKDIEGKSHKLTRVLKLAGAENILDSAHVKYDIEFMDYSDGSGSLSVLDNTHYVGEKVGEGTSAEISVCLKTLKKEFGTCEEYEKLCLKPENEKDSKCPGKKKDKVVDVSPSEVTAGEIKAGTDSGAMVGKVVELSPDLNVDVVPTVHQVDEADTN
jgi:hypothetical protein